MADTHPIGESRFRFESGALRPDRSTLRVGVSRPWAYEPTSPYEARRQAGFVFRGYSATVTETRWTALFR